MIDFVEKKLAGGIIVKTTPPGTLSLNAGADLRDFRLGVETFGTLNADRSNAILICHALTGDQFVCGTNPMTGRAGWWHNVVGPNKPIDTNRYFVICSNVPGGCMGSTGPGDVDPDTGRAYGLTFPLLSIADMVRAQKQLIEWLGIERLLAVVGGSMGGMQALQWARSYPTGARAIVALACTLLHSAQNIALHEVGRQAIMTDPDWHNGNYDAHGVRPDKGLSVARMCAHVTYLSETAMFRKFGRRGMTAVNDFSPILTPNFQVEGYLHHQGSVFTQRFDANSYLYITKAVDNFDLIAEAGGNETDVFKGTDARFLIISYSSDWLYPPAESRRIVRALNAVAADVGALEIDTDKGHDAFLLDDDTTARALRGFLDAAASA